MSKSSTEPLKIVAGGFSSAGIKEQNQDAFAVKVTKGIELETKGHVAVIADGVSSANYAAQASQMSVCHFIEEYLATPNSWSVSKSASKIIAALNSWLYSRTQTSTSNLQEQQWFSTFSAIILKGTQAKLFHIGDCQIAKINKDGYQVLTKQHSTPSGILNRALGASNHVKVDFATTEIEKEDIFFLSCDGVYDFIDKKEVVKIIAHSGSLEAASQQICESAQANGSQDNLTCLLIRVENAPDISFNQLVAQRQQQVIPPALPVGAVLDDFEILGIKQQTARSHVYLARDKQHNSDLIIKVPSLNFAEDQQYISAFIKEGWIGEKFNQQNLMKIHPRDHNSQFLYHVCEKIDGMPLDTWMQNNPSPSLNQVKLILKQMINALRSLQRMDIVHCDLKPDNFLIDTNGTLTLIDYGSCKIGCFEENDTDRPLGTLTYSAPEVLYGANATYKSDLFSMAIITYQMLSGHLPFKTLSSVADIPKSLQQWHYRPLSTFRKDLPQHIDATLKEALCADPNKRTASFSQMFEGFKHKPNESFNLVHQQPLITRNPILFWQGVSACLATALFISVIF